MSVYFTFDVGDLVRLPEWCRYMPTEAREFEGCVGEVVKARVTVSSGKSVKREVLVKFDERNACWLYIHYLESV